MTERQGAANALISTLQSSPLLPSDVREKLGNVPGIVEWFVPVHKLFIPCIFKNCDSKIPNIKRWKYGQQRDLQQRQNLQMWRWAKNLQIHQHDSPLLGGGQGCPKDGADDQTWGGDEGDADEGGEEQDGEGGQSTHNGKQELWILNVGNAAWASRLKR